MQLCNASQRQRLADFFGGKVADEEEKVRQVLALYEEIHLKPEIEKAIAEEFAKSIRTLDEIKVDEEKKTPLREMLETLNGRKK